MGKGFGALILRGAREGGRGEIAELYPRFFLRNYLEIECVFRACMDDKNFE